MKRKYEVIGIVIDTEKEAEKCSFLSAVLDCKIENFAKITDFFWGGEIERFNSSDAGTCWFENERKLSNRRINIGREKNTVFDKTCC